MLARHALCAFSAIVCAGCATFSVDAIPSRQLPPHLLAQRKPQEEPINLALLRQDPPAEYRLDSGDVLGIYIEGIVGNRDQPPPVHFPQQGEAPVGIGYPFPVAEDGTIALPLVAPIRVIGLTLEQTRQALVKAYTVDRKLLADDPELPASSRVLVSLMRRRTYDVLVIREESDLGEARREEVRGRRKRGTGDIVRLTAYENDVLHALAETGGLPGLDAANEVQIHRSKPTVFDQPTVRIPLHIAPGAPPAFAPADVVLNSGDVVFIDSRDHDVFYTGGLLSGGEHLLPRDYALDVLGAIAIAGGSVGGTGGAGVGFRIYTVPPSEALVVRKTPGGQFIPIKVNLQRALTDPSERLIVQPGDTIILRRTPLEELTQFFVTIFRLNAQLTRDGILD